MEEQSLIPFEEKSIRKVWHNEEWYFAIIDIIAILAETPSPRQYWTKVKNGLVNENQLQPFWLQLKMIAPDGKNRLTDCANTEGILRIVMAVPSPKAEPLKLWMAQVSKERIEEIENPELSFERMTEIYKAKGYPDEWIRRRVQSIETRKALTDEWKLRGIKEGQEYSILTATIAKGTFGLTPSEHGRLKNLGKENLRDHMTPLELVFTALSEEVTRSIVVKDDAQGFEQNQEAASYGGSLAADARLRLERERGITVVSTSNFLGLNDGKNDELTEGNDPK